MTTAVTVQIPLGAVRVEAPAPAMVSQHNVLHTIGMKPRAFLEAARSFEAAGGTVTKYGRCRMVALDDFVTWLRRRQATDATPGHDTAAELAAELGLRAVGS